MPPAPPPPSVTEWAGPSGERWVKYQRSFDRMLAPVGDLVLAAARPRLAERVLDVGCGAGTTTLALARAVGRRGAVTGVDISPQLLAAARRRSSRIQFALADAAQLAIPPVDLVFSRFGVMFFLDPVAAFAHLRSLAPGGRLAFACWRRFADNPWMRDPMRRVARLLGKQLGPADDLPGAFGLATRSRLARILRDAGWRGVAIERVDLPLCLSAARTLRGAIAEYVASGPRALGLADMPEPLRGRAIEALSGVFGPHFGKRGLWLDGSVWIVTARA